MLRHCRDERERIIREESEKQTRSFTGRPVGDLSEFLDSDVEYDREIANVDTNTDSQSLDKWSFVLDSESGKLQHDHSKTATQ